MISVHEAQQRILAHFQPVEIEVCPLDLACGRVLAAGISATRDLPPFDNSSVDGFAVRSADLAPASVSSWSLRVVADIRAGVYSDTPLQPGECARIMTGAPLPPNSDAVVMVEDTDFTDRNPGTPAPAKVSIHRPVKPGENLRRRGDDLRQGERVLEAGTRLRAQEIGLLAMLGLAQVTVYRKPRLALLSSGDELLPLDAPLAPGKIHDANTHTLSALARGSGVEVISLGVAADTEADIRSRLGRAVDERADVIVASAGVSVGAFDYVKSVLESDGELDFWRVNMRPGKPLAFGKYGGVPFFGLPGNPVSAFVGFEVFVRPALERLSGIGAERSHSVRPRPVWKVRLAEAIESDGRESYLRAVVTEEGGRLTARLTGHQGSGNIFSLVRANALLIVPSGVKCVPADSEIDAWLLE
ncbi:MAG: gephyrin-like molybdotransferase Glp [Chloroflexota bacterium]